MKTIQHFFWHRQPAIDQALLREFADLIRPGSLVVDVGAGYDPWPFATEFVDRAAWPELVGKKVHVLDVELDRLPYADKQVDFLYCRHTVEDLHNPTLLLREMNRVAKAGYIETPSPLAELARGASGPLNQVRGFAHHRWFVWVEQNRTLLLPKHTVVELPEVFDVIDDRVAEILNASPEHWNTCIPWRGSFPYVVMAHREHFDLTRDYPQTLFAGLEAALVSNQRFCDYFHLLGQDFVASPLSDT